MPIDYKKYPANWKTEIRPAILTRAFHRCEFCNVANYMIIIRGSINGQEIYQDDNGSIYDANTSECIGDGYLGDNFDKPDKGFIKVVLTIAHLDHDIANNDYANLKAACQRCHLRHDKDHHLASRRSNKLSIQPQLFE